MKVTTIHRPFAESYTEKKIKIKREIKSSIDKVKGGITKGISTIVFPEGTTWGFGGLKRIRSIVYQLVEKTILTIKKKVYILPVNIKVDRLTVGKKDVFINVGNPVFIEGTKEAFNKKLYIIIERLHTITFSQIGALFMKRVAEIEVGAHKNISISFDDFLENIEWIIHEIVIQVQLHKLPDIDISLLDKKYLYHKAEKFIDYCKKKEYVNLEYQDDGNEIITILPQAVLAKYPAKIFRKKNPLSFHANMLLSLGKIKLRRLFDNNLHQVYNL